MILSYTRTNEKMERLSRKRLGKRMRNIGRLYKALTLNPKLYEVLSGWDKLTIKYKKYDCIAEYSIIRRENHYEWKELFRFPEVLEHVFLEYYKKLGIKLPKYRVIETAEIIKIENSKANLIEYKVKLIINN